MTITPPPGDDLQAQALLWVVRVGDPEFVDWEQFDTWLSVDPMHAAAYHSAADAEQTMVDRLATAVSKPAAMPQALLRNPQSRRRSLPWIGAGLAASVVLVVTFGSLRPGGGAVIYQTGAGEHRNIILTDGSRIAMNGDTRISLAANDRRTIQLERGEALFTVRHDPARPFSVQVGDAKIADVGTVFDVTRERDATRVAVAEGTVMWKPGSNPVRLAAGSGLRANDGGSIELISVHTAAVGDWSTGQLSYDGAALSVVAGDIARTLGVTVTVAPDVANRSVRGILRLNGGADLVLPRLAALLGLRVRHDGAAWTLTSSP